MSKQNDEQEMVVCPLCRFFTDLEKVAGRKSKFFDHLSQSRIEFLKAVRSLVDERIEDIEKKRTKGKKRITKIKVE
jgi:hypothetical protein